VHRRISSTFTLRISSASRVLSSEALTKKCGHCIRQEFERNNAKTLCLEQLSGYDKTAVREVRPAQANAETAEPWPRAARFGGTEQATARTMRLHAAGVQVYLSLAKIFFWLLTMVFKVA
jgi:hypothetical protein